MQGLEAKVCDKTPAKLSRCIFTKAFRRRCNLSLEAIKLPISYPQIVCRGHGPVAVEAKFSMQAMY